MLLQREGSHERGFSSTEEERKPAGEEHLRGEICTYPVKDDTLPEGQVHGRGKA